MLEEQLGCGCRKLPEGYVYPPKLWDVIHYDCGREIGRRVVRGTDVAIQDFLRLYCTDGCTVYTKHGITTGTFLGFFSEDYWEGDVLATLVCRDGADTLWIDPDSKHPTVTREMVPGTQSFTSVAHIKDGVLSMKMRHMSGSPLIPVTREMKYDWSAGSIPARAELIRKSIDDEILTKLEDG